MLALRFQLLWLSCYVIQHLPSRTRKVLNPSHVFKSLCFLTRWPFQCYHLSSPPNYRILLLLQYASKIHPQVVINQNTLAHRIDIAAWLIICCYVSELDVPSAHNCHMIVLFSLRLLLSESVSLIQFLFFFSYPESNVGNDRNHFILLSYSQSREHREHLQIADQLLNV